MDWAQYYAQLTAMAKAGEELGFFENFFHAGAHAARALHEAIPMGLLLFRARDKIKTGDGCWAESRSSIPGNRRGLLGCGVDFFIALLERQGSFSARTIRL